MNNLSSESSIPNEAEGHIIGPAPETSLGNELEKPYISVWLMLGEKEAGVLRGVVDELAEEFGTYAFDPHLTIISGFNAEPGEVSRVISPLSGSAGPFVFEIEDVVVGDRMTKTFYVTFKPMPDFEDYCRQYVGTPITEKASIPDPHMSLMYKSGGPAGFTDEKRDRLEIQRQEIKAKLLEEIPSISFDGISLVTSKHTLREDSDVLDYKTVQSFPA